MWRRALRHQFGPAGAGFEAALANSSRILPTVTTAHDPSAANNSYWPELYLNHSLIDAAHPGPYTDTPSPRVFGAVSPLDPQLFYRIDDFADDLLKGERNGKYTPIEVAQWLGNYAAAAATSLARADGGETAKPGPEYRRLSIDIAVAAGLGSFFGSKFRAAVLYRIFDRTGDRAALEAALKAYRNAREAWATIASQTQGVYMADITVGEMRQLRGHWSDRLAEIDADIAAVAAKLDSAKPAQAAGPIVRAIGEALGRPRRPAVAGRHSPRPGFQPGQPVEVEFAAEKDYASVLLHYRRVNQAERWQSEPMKSIDRIWRAAIPAEYTQSAYPVQYYFELREMTEVATLYPGFGEQLIGQPYFVIRQQHG